MSNVGLMSTTTVQRTATGDTRIDIAGALRDYLRAAGLPVLTELALRTPAADGKIHTACAMWCAQRVAWSHGESLLA